MVRVMGTAPRVASVSPPRRGASGREVPAGHPGGQVGCASIRFQGTGAHAGLNVSGESVEVPAGARGTWTVSYRADAWPVQPGGSVTIWKWGPKFVFGMGLQGTDPAHPDYCSAHVRCASEADNPSGRPPEPAARVELTDLAPAYKRYRQARLVIREHALTSGDSVCFVAGDTSGGAPPNAVIAYTARDVAIDVQVDHDGDGHPEFQQRLWIHVVPDRATRLRAVAPSVVVAGEPFAVEVRAEDVHCKPGAALEGEVRVTTGSEELGRAAFPAAGAERPGRLRLDGLRLAEPGIARLEVVATPAGGGAELAVRTNPMRVIEARPHPSPAARVPALSQGEGTSRPLSDGAGHPLHIYWGEMHNHTTWCEGMATVDENYRFARDAAGLDWYSVSEHIMLGPGNDFPITDEDSPMASSAAYWRDCQTAAQRYHQPGRFVTYIGYEWTALLEYDAAGVRRNERRTWGDHCAWFLRDDHPLVIANSLEGELAALAALAHDALARGEPPPGMIIPHPGGGATDWTHYAGRDVVAMPAVETSSMHAHTEWFYQRAIETGRRDGFRLGVCAMDDGHMGHPGYDVWARHGVSTLRERAYSVQGGITAVLAPELTREAVWDAFFDRRTYATSGERMLLDVWVENAISAGSADPRHVRAHRPAGEPPAPGQSGRLSMGQAGKVGEAPRFRLQASGTAPLDLVEVIRDDRRVQRWVLPPDSWDVDLTWTDPEPLRDEAAYYVRVTQSGEAFAWSSPIWVACSAPSAVPREAAVATLPVWHEGVWPPEQGDAERSETAAYLLVLEAFLARQGAGGRYVELRPVGMFREHRGRYALFRGYDAGGPTFATSITRPASATDGDTRRTNARERAPVTVRYYPDFPENRIRVGAGWVDFGVGRR